ncbi:hypothetical protein I6J22_06950 [Corynebacterium kroppenstedtii]|uniref:Putative secreted protein n=1 Tax=Corynebacterium kroppenstedtii (strain DSM 44385 / JCM 11950 / CIP 105744 / CCUG 35717) TaxID=645127 RepID=C4LLN0_CORK4|nr:hypothetical protein [Corynebacterium kroppenstedtii]ACR18735.1 putative secreted protein [Corynebacterium kroppenstedtii DSM 44385]QRP09973.1 hypothetical protein I6J22_06950 [Corynebacterium kroppenstedtii]
MPANVTSDSIDRDNTIRSTRPHVGRIAAGAAAIVTGASLMGATAAQAEEAPAPAPAPAPEDAAQAVHHVVFNTPEVDCQVTENPDSIACGSNTPAAQSQNSQQAGDGAVCGPDLNADRPAFETKQGDPNSVKLSCTHQGFAGDTTVLDGSSPQTVGHYTFSFETDGTIHITADGGNKVVDITPAGTFDAA